MLLLGLPALMSAGLAFTSYDALSPPVWVGFRNFRTLAADPLAGVALTNTLIFVLLAVPLRVLGALALALLLSRRRRGVGAYRSAVYLPTVIPDVAFALIWLWIFNPLYGPVNQVLDALGLPTPGWLADAETAKYPFVVMSLFQIGEGFLVLLVGASGDIPRLLRRGCRRWRQRPADVPLDHAAAARAVAVAADLPRRDRGARVHVHAIGRDDRRGPATTRRCSCRCSSTRRRSTGCGSAWGRR